MQTREKLWFARTAWRTAAVFLVFGLAVHAQDMKQVSSSLTAKIAAAGRKKVAVVDFTDLQGNVTELGRFLAEELSGALAEDARGFRVVDRTHLKVILQEHKLASTGLIDPQTARQLGRISGVDTLVTGTITSAFGDSVRLSVKALDVETAEIIAQSRADIPKTKAIEEMGRGSGEVPAGVGATAASSSPGVAAKPGGMTIRDNEFIFAMRGCRRHGEDVTCVAAVTNKEEKRRYVHLDQSATTLVDQLGDEYHTRDVAFGSPGRTDQCLEPELPLNASVTFQAVSTNTSSATLIVPYCFGQCGYSCDGFSKAVLRDVPIQQR